MAELTIEQQKALALAAARKRQMEAAPIQAQVDKVVNGGDWVTPGQGEPGIPLVPAGITEFTRSLYPVEQNTKTGETRLAVPKIIPNLISGTIDALTLPGDVYSGKVNPVSEEGADRVLNLSGFASGGGLKSAAKPEISVAAKNTARALTADKVPAGGVMQRLEDLGPDAMVMDLGPNTQRQAAALASLPGDAQTTVRDAVTTRSAGAVGRVTDDVAKTVGASPDLVKLHDDIVNAQKAVADPLYAEVRDVGIKVPPALNFVLNSPLGKAALRKAQDMAANDGYTPSGLTVGVVDYVKQALDDTAAEAARTGKNNEARQARNMAKAITSAVDAQVPGYKRARDAFAGPARVLEAIEDGQGVFGKDLSPSQLKSKLDGMSPSEQDAYLQGVRGSVEAQLGNAVNEPLALRNLLRKGWNESKLRLLLGDELTTDLLKRIDREVTFSKTRNVVTEGSETAARKSAQPEVDPQQADVKQINLLGLIFSAINKARAGVRGKIQPKVNSDLATILSATGKTIDPAALSEVQRAMQPQPFLPSGLRDMTRAGTVAQPELPPEILLQLKA